MIRTKTGFKTPYKGLIPYSEEDADFFFGREKEQNSITSNLIAERLTLLYGGSGVGKSSVLRAGVEHHLGQLAEQNIKRLGKPKYVVVVFNDWRDPDPIRSLLNKVREAVTKTLKGRQIKPIASSLSLTEALHAWSQHVRGRLLIILDQFEEYFLYHPNEDGEGTFATQFPRAVNTPDLPVNFLISFREDAMAKLDFFKVRMPGLFGNFLRVDHLDRKGGEAAIKKPLDRYNEQIQKNGSAGNFSKVDIEGKLVQEVLKQVKVGEKLIGDSGLGGVEKESGQPTTDLQIETPYLQLVMTRIWEEELRLREQQKVTRDKPLMLRLQTLNDLKGAKHIVQTHLDNVMAKLSSAERNLGAKIFNHMVTPSGTKFAQTVPDLSDSAKISPSKRLLLTNMMEKLSSGDKRIFRVLPPPPNQEFPRYEVFHDRLAEAIIEWRRRYSARQQRNRWILGASALAVLLIFMSSLTVYALKQKTAAQSATQQVIEEKANVVIAFNEANKQKEAAQSATRQVTEEKAKVVSALDEANKQRNMAEKQTELARTAQVEAAKQRDEAVRQKNIAENAKAQLAKQNVQLERNQKQLHEQNEELEATKSTLTKQNIALEAANKKAKELEKEAETQRDAAIEAKKEAEEQRARAEKERERAEEEVRIVHEIDSSNAYYKAVMRGHTDNVTYAVLSNDAQKVLTRSDDSTARVWKVNKADDEADLPAITSEVGAIIAAAFSPDGRFVVITSHASQAYGGSLTIWDVSKDKPESLASAGFTEGPSLNSVQFSPDGKLLLDVEPDEGVLIRGWDAEKRQLSDPILSFAKDATSAAFSGDGKLVVTADGNNAEVWDASAGTKLKSFPHGANGIGVKTVAFSPNGKYVITTSDDNSVRVFETASGKLVATFGLDTPINAAAISPDEKYLVAVGTEREAHLFDIQRRSKLADLSGHTGLVTNADFSPDGKYILTSSADKTARVWDLKGNLIAELRGHTGAVNTAFFDPKSKYVVTSSDDRTARVWDISSNASERPFGTKELDMGNSLDLDTGEETGKPSNRTDIAWDDLRNSPNQMKSVNRQMRPINGARIVNVTDTKFEQLSFTQLQGLNYSDVPINGKDDKSNQLLDGSVFAVLTSEGSYAKVQVFKYEKNIKLRWVLYKPNAARGTQEQKSSLILNPFVRPHAGPSFLDSFEIKASGD